MISVIFDMDGTLLDTQQVCIPAWDYGGEQQGFNNLGKLIPQVCGMNEAGWQAFLLQNVKGLDLERFLSDIQEYYVKHSVVKPKKGMYELLNFLKSRGVKMAVASGTRRSDVERNFAEVNALSYFDAVIGGDMVENGKPEPDIFLIAAEAIGASPENCFVFEDSSAGVTAGSNANMRVIGIADVAPFTEAAKSLLYCELSSLDEAIDILKKFL